MPKLCLLFAVASDHALFANGEICDLVQCFLTPEQETQRVEIDLSRSVTRAGSIKSRMLASITASLIILCSSVRE